MIDRDETAPDDEAAESLARLLGHTPLTERHLIGQIEDELGTPRCPACRGVLVARQGRGEPYFQCLCPPRRVEAAKTARQHRRPGTIAAPAPIPLRETG